MPILVVEKYKNPRCFKGRIPNDLNVSYASSPKAWMNFSTLRKWPKEFDNLFFRTSGKHVALLIENALAQGNSMI